MWKASAGHAPTIVDKKDDDDWETEPDFVVSPLSLFKRHLRKEERGTRKLMESKRQNDVSEKEQRWGAKTLDTDLNQFGNGNLTPAELARRAVAAHEAKSKEETEAIKYPFFCCRTLRVQSTNALSKGRLVWPPSKDRRRPRTTISHLYLSPSFGGRRN